MCSSLFEDIQRFGIIPPSSISIASFKLKAAKTKFVPITKKTFSTL